MKVINISLNNVDYIGNLSLCLGYFDAFHIGHIELIKEALKSGTKSAVLTMEPNPKSFFIHKNEGYINSLKEKEQILEGLGVDYFIILKVDQDLLNLSPEEFVDNILMRLGVYKVICGYDYTFGKNKLGNAQVLRLLSNTRCFNVQVIEQIKTNSDEKISTTLIRNLIMNGNVELANQYLYKKFSIQGVVCHGNKLGNSFGYATANIGIENSYLLPKKGVYAGSISIEGKEYITMINVGTHPTIKESNNTLVEAHILDFNEDIYDKFVEVTFLKFIRDEKKFTSVDELIKQLNKDEKLIRSLYL